MSSDGARKAPTVPARASVLRIAILVVVLGGAVTIAAYYQEFIGAFFTQQGWNPGAADEVARRFVRLTHDPTGGEQAAALLDTESVDRLKPIVEGGRLVRLTHGEGRDRHTNAVEDFLAQADVTASQTDLLHRDGGVFRVLLRFGDRGWAEYRVRRDKGARKIERIPFGLSPTLPPRGLYEY